VTRDSRPASLYRLILQRAAADWHELIVPGTEWIRNEQQYRHSSEQTLYELSLCLFVCLSVPAQFANKRVHRAYRLNSTLWT